MRLWSELGSVFPSRLGRRPSLCHESLFPLFPTALSCLGSRVDGPSGVSSCPLGPAALRRLGTPWKGGPPWSLPGATSSRQLPGQGDHPEGRGWRSRGPGGGEPVGAVNQSVSVVTGQAFRYHHSTLVSFRSSDTLKEEPLKMFPACAGGAR